ncbi:MAG: hypothetical protein ACQEWG_10540 [Bacteroidota bacterium]
MSKTIQKEVMVNNSNQPQNSKLNSKEINSLMILLEYYYNDELEWYNEYLEELGRPPENSIFLHWRVILSYLLENGLFSPDYLYE